MSKEDQRKFIKDMSITITGSHCLSEYPLYVPSTSTRDEINCVDSYEMYCGPAQPFPYIEMTLKKQRLQTYYPALLDDLKAGRNIIYVNAVGKEKFILSKVKTSGRTITLTGYSPYEVFKSVKFPTTMSYVATCASGNTFSFTATTEVMKNPVKLLVYCLTSNHSSISGISLAIDTYHIMISPGLLRCLERDSEADVDYMWISKRLMIQEGGGTAAVGTFTLKFDQSLTLWQVINTCAAVIGARVYFIGDYAYIIDDCDPGMPQPYEVYNRESNPNINTVRDNPWLVEAHQYLTAKDRRPMYPTASQREFTSRIMDTPELGNEGVETVYNLVLVSASTVEGSTAYGYTLLTPNKGSVPFLDRADWWSYNNPQYGKYHIYPTISGTDSTADISIQGSRNFYGICSKTIDLPCYCVWSGDTDTLVANRGGFLYNPMTHLISAKMMMHLADAEQSIGFKMTEMGKTYDDDGTTEHSYWEPYYWMTLEYSSDSGLSGPYEIGPLARVKGFTDYVNETDISNKQNYGDLRELPGKLTLSKIVRHFPGMYSEYWFGIIEVCDLTAELSKIMYKTV